ncbi:hypothetical protein BDD12DRAFT_929620 [Trichophaea hybrida]|nr:hypothetical protein BDD12DRAFT_929620 [Trichophaea hybrida]
MLSAIDKDNCGERATLVESIGKDSVDGFLRVARRFNFKIYSFYEQFKTRKLVKGADGRFRRSGDYYIAVDSESTLLNLNNVEKRIPVDADHSSMVKFGVEHLHPYTEVAKYLRDTMNEVLIRLEDKLSNRSISPQKEQQSLQEQANMWREKYDALAKPHSQLHSEHLLLLKKYEELKLAKETASTVQQATGVFETRADQEQAGEISSALECCLQVERQRRADAMAQIKKLEEKNMAMETRVDEMRLESQIKKKECERAWEELGRREQEEREIITSLKGGHPALEPPQSLAGEVILSN